MPAVDPARLKREMEHLRATLPDLDRFQREALDLIQRYEDKTQRPARSLRTGRVFSTPLPMIKMLARELGSDLEDNPDLHLQAADALWDSANIELRYAAIQMAAYRTGPDVPALAERWARGCETFEVLDELADTGIGAWRDASSDLFLPQVEIWLDKPWIRVQTFALLALKHAAGQQAFQDLPTVFRLLHPVDRFERREARRALIQLVEELARRSPQEAAFFVIDELQQGGKRAKQLARKTLPIFPAPQQRLIQRTLSP
ncbi:MAG: DNA alkylation repair protein [Anaerolineales bacterium]|nr:DNA alkylation repair protein [Anaerolineales bacterium]